MQIFRTVDELRGWSRSLRQSLSGSSSVGLVPTMGALHAGHASLIRTAADLCSDVAVSIFVNPTQFGPNEDFARYPRPFEADCELAEQAGATAIFAPTVDELYPKGAKTFVDVGEIGNRLDGASRPSHFRGVATVVSKLLIAAEADYVFFGQKDAAQVAVLRKLIADMRFPTRVIVCPIIRDTDGLALSSRNVYLSSEERKQALVLSRALQRVELLVTAGERSAAALLDVASVVFVQEPSVKVDYIELVNWETLLPCENAVSGSLFAVAVWIGKTRLIDNMIFSDT